MLSSFSESPIIAAAGLRRRRVAQAALLWLRLEGPLNCRELPLQGWLSCSRLDAARAGGGTRARRPRRAPLRPQTPRQGIARDPTGAAPNGGRKRQNFRTKIVFPQLGSHS